MIENLNKKILILIFATATILRLAGTLSYIEKRTPAEGNILSNSIYMWERGTLEQKEFAYPSLYYYASITAQKVAYYTLFLLGVYPDIDRFLNSVHFWHNVYVTGRLLSVLFTLIIFIFLYKLASEEFNKDTALISSLFLTFSYIDVINSRLAKPDSLVNLMVFLSVYFSIKYFESENKKFLYLASLFVGLSVSSKYFFISSAPLILAILFKKEKTREKIKNLFLAGIASIVFFAVTCPFCIIDYKNLIKTFTGAQNFTGGYIVPVFHTYTFVAKDLLKYTGYGILLLAIAGIIMAFKKEWKTHIILLAFPLIYTFMLCISKVYGPRYLVYIFPYISLYAGYALIKLSKKRVLALALAIIFVLPEAIPSFRAATWLTVGKTNIEIMNDFIKNSLPDNNLVISYHAYRLESKQFLNYPKFVLNFKRPKFFVYGFYEDYFCWPQSKYMQFCEDLKNKMAGYNSVLELKEHHIPEYVLDYPLSLYKRNFPARKPQIQYPVLVKLPGKSKFLFPGNHYVKDSVIISLKPYKSYSKLYFSTGEGKICILIQKLSRGKYSVYTSLNKWKNIKDNVFYQCETPPEGTGKIRVKSKGAFLNIVLTTSPLNLAQILIENYPYEAIHFLEKVSRDKFYSFEANRMLAELYMKSRNVPRAKEKLSLIKSKAAILRESITKDFQKNYMADGFDLRYFYLSQRIYPEFSKNKKESNFFYLFPGVYKLSAEFKGILVSKNGTRKPLSPIIWIDTPGWYKIIAAESRGPIDFYLYFDPAETLKLELTKLKDIEDNLK